MNAKMEMKRLRDNIRHQLRRMRKDPFLKDVAPHITIEMVKWNAKQHMVLLRFRDTRKPMTEYNSQSTRWAWLYTYSDCIGYEIWKELNQLIIAMRDEV